MYCRNCGTENSTEAKFCRNCGTTLEQSIDKSSGQDKLLDNKKKNKLRIVIIAAIILMTVIIATFFVSKMKNEKRIEKEARDYQKRITQAEKYLEEMDYENAEDSYLEAITIDPKQEEPYIRLADVYLVQEEYDKAVNILEKAEKILGETNSGKLESSISERKKEIQERGKYTWVVKPTIEAENIDYITDTGYYYKSRNGSFLQFESPYAVVWVGDTLGLIDLNGNMKGNMEYKWVGCWDGDFYALRSIEAVEVEGSNYTSDVYMLIDDELILDTGRGSNGGVGNYAFYWCNGLHHIDESYDWAEDVKNPTLAFPVKQAEYIYSGEFENGLSWWLDLSGKYAVCKGEQLITDFIYDKCGSFSNGLLAVCQNGKWGYINEMGEIIIPIEYDASWNKTIEQANYTFGENGKTEEFCYAANDGYIPLVKDGKWELRDTNDKLVILSGVFESIRPVYEGKCWVKKDGRWGVIQLEENEDS